MAVLIIFSGIMAGQISAVEEKECWNVLDRTAQQTAGEIKKQINSD